MSGSAQQYHLSEIAMTVVSFPPRPPSSQEVLEAVYRLTEALPGWRFEVDKAQDDGCPSVSAEHLATGVMMGAHWGGNHWGVVTEGGTLVYRSTELLEALRRALG